MVSRQLRYFSLHCNHAICHPLTETTVVIKFKLSQRVLPFVVLSDICTPAVIFSLPCRLKLVPKAMLYGVVAPDCYRLLAISRETLAEAVSTDARGTFSRHKPIESFSVKIIHHRHFNYLNFIGIGNIGVSITLVPIIAPSSTNIIISHPRLITISHILSEPYFHVPSRISFIFSNESFRKLNVIEETLQL